MFVAVLLADVKISTKPSDDTRGLLLKSAVTVSLGATLRDLLAVTDGAIEGEKLGNGKGKVVGDMDVLLDFCVFPLELASTTSTPEEFWGADVLLGASFSVQFELVATCVTF